MKKSNIDCFRCPSCRSALSVKEKTGDSLSDDCHEGRLVCPRCHSVFPIHHFIPRFVVPGAGMDSFGLQWNRHRSVQLDSRNGYHLSEKRLHRATGWFGSLEGLKILEVGCGAGRFTEVLLKKGAQVFSFDASSAVDANFGNNGKHPSLYLFQADLYRIPLPHGFFDKVLCLGVLQHTPDPRGAFLSLIPFLKEGGEIVVDVYKKTFFSLFHWKYLLRPFLRGLPPLKLYSCIEKVVPLLLPFSTRAQRGLGRTGARLFPIANYAHLHISHALNRELSVLDTFDMYAPRYDIPQTLCAVKRWLTRAGLEDANVAYGPNGIIARGVKPHDARDRRQQCAA